MSLPAMRSSRSVRKSETSLSDLPFSLEENDLPRKSRITIVAFVSILTIFIALAALTPVHDVIVSNGAIVSVGLAKTVKHTEGGIIQDIFVKDGDFVEENQLLLRLQPDGALKNFNYMQAQQVALKVKAECLRAIGMGEAPRFDQFANQGIDDIVQDQRNVYDIKMREFRNQHALIKRQFEQQKKKLLAPLAQKHDLISRIHILEEHRDLIKGLVEKKLQTRTNLYRVEDQLAEVRDRFNQTNTTIMQIQEAISESERQMVGLNSSLRNEALNELAKITATFLEMDEMSAKFQEQARRLEVRAPAQGIVHDFKTDHVIGPGVMIMEILPADGLEIEAKVRPDDIAQIRVGHPVMIKVSAYDFSRYGTVQGRVKSVSESKVIVVMNRFYVGKNPRMNRVMPGMATVIEVQTDRKYLLNYITQPMMNVYMRAFQER